MPSRARSDCEAGPKNLRSMTRSEVARVTGPISAATAVAPDLALVSGSPVGSSRGRLAQSATVAFRNSRSLHPLTPLPFARLRAIIPLVTYRRAGIRLLLGFSPSALSLAALRYHGVDNPDALTYSIRRR